MAVVLLAMGLVLLVPVLQQGQQQGRTKLQQLRSMLEQGACKKTLVCRWM
jgi:hypothetical protein